MNQKKQKKADQFAQEVGKPTPTDWKLTKEQRTSFQALHILYFMLRKGIRFPNFLRGKLALIESVITFLEDKKLIVESELPSEPKKILGYTYGNEVPTWIYAPTPEAESVIQNYEQRLYEFYKLYDVFAHVDTESGNFAMEEWLNIETKEGPEAWEEYKQHNRWWDLRIPVCVYKGIDPREMVFMSMVTSGQMDLDPNDKEFTWAEKLFSEELWNEMYEALSTAPKWEQFDHNGDPANVMEDIIWKGSEVVQGLNTKLDQFIAKKTRTIAWADGELAKESDSRYDEDDDDDSYTTIETRTEYYYEDPVWYIGPWYNPIYDPLFWIIVL